MAQGERNRTIDFLRVAAAFSVIWLHVAAYVFLRNIDLASLNWWLSDVSLSFARWGSPVFIMLSGLVLIPKARGVPIEQFLARRMPIILVPTFLWTAIYFALGALVKEDFSAAGYLKGVMAGDPFFQLWFLYVLAGLYFVTPIVQRSVDGLDDKALAALLVVTLVLPAAESFTGGSAGQLFLTKFVPYLGYYIVGFALVERFKDVRFDAQVLLGAVLICGAAVTALTAAVQYELGGKSYEIIQNRFDPFVMIMSICVFALSFKWEPHAFFTKLAPLTPGIFLIHPIWIKIVEKAGISGTLYTPAVGVPVASGLVFTLSALSTHAIRKTRFRRLMF